MTVFHLHRESIIFIKGTIKFKVFAMTLVDKQDRGIVLSLLKR